MAQLKEKWKGRGTATIYEDDSIEFRPTGNGQPVQRNVRKRGNSKFYQTNGEKESNFVAHLSAPTGSLDPVGDMLKDFEALTKELQPVTPPKPRTKPIMKREGQYGETIEVYVDRKEHCVRVFATLPLEENNPLNPADWAYTLIGAPLSLCFTSNRKSILTAYRQPEKTSSK
jgi:hypothetical protein